MSDIVPAIYTKFCWWCPVCGTVYEEMDLEHLLDKVVFHQVGHHPDQTELRGYCND
jgi:hypothetical protein|tara:strand:+ start:1320 stop:1487 length:168 start_codon:yes stop_codon:yes gene_type:complete